ncbi:ribonuclease III [Campylobacter sp. FMV-PI01]|uniref:Ribonuclease 3 n=1 Tax=Campylobacter portucalensis TaxID=2608384 RepID=A0A6L5WK54_9BACT|nr:ribonuclease III [Campylobacter portucalensis]MSN96233.1 ribonuclease III [Campylobacter portucalensis]
MEKLEKKLGYKFRDISVLERALTHKSSTKAFNNERLEFLGDAVMDLVVAKYLFDKFKGCPEGDLSKLRAALVNEKSFATLARKINLGDFLYISLAEDNNNGRHKDSILSDAFEALMGAIFLESGLDEVEKISISLFEKEYKNISLDALVKDYKTTLQEITQAKFALIPEYKLISSKGPDHNKNFEMGVFLNGIEYGKAIGRSKKEGEQKAAKIAIEKIKKGKI